MSRRTDQSDPDKVNISKSKYRGKTDYDVVFQDQHILVANKPPGLLTVPISGMKAVNLQDLIDRDLKYKREVRAAHRIDRYTSGLVVFGLHKKAHSGLKDQFRNRTPERIYLAVVRGRLQQKEGKLVHYLKQVKAGFRNIVVSKHKKGAGRAELDYQVVDEQGDRSLVRIQLITGLKNQIRVQFAEMGHPLIGDRHYEASEKNRKEIDRQALHASELTFAHPITNKPVRNKATLPADMKRVLREASAS